MSLFPYFLFAGGFNHTAGMPEKVYKKEFDGKHQLSQSYVSLGTNGRFFIKRKTGWTQWSDIDEEFGEYVKANDVKHVTFGEDNDSWFALLDRGGGPVQGCTDAFEAAHSSNNKSTPIKSSWM